MSTLHARDMHVSVHGCVHDVLKCYVHNESASWKSRQDTVRLHHYTTYHATLY